MIKYRGKFLLNNKSVYEYVKLEATQVHQCLIAEIYSSISIFIRVLVLVCTHLQMLKTTKTLNLILLGVL